MNIKYYDVFAKAEGMSEWAHVSRHETQCEADVRIAELQSAGLETKTETEIELINITSKGIEIDGHTGTWYVIDHINDSGQDLYLLESEQHGDDAACLIVYRWGAIVLDDVWNGFDDYYDSLLC